MGRGAFGAHQSLHPTTPTHSDFFLPGIKGLAVPQQKPAAQQTLSSQGHWIYA